jgi:hypothetical protein
MTAKGGTVVRRNEAKIPVAAVGDWAHVRVQLLAVLR